MNDAPHSGFTTRVLRGAVLAMGGQIAVLGASLAFTPITIRGLGAEAYGVLALVHIVAGSLSFADFGMGTASTAVGAEAFAKANRDQERSVVLTALLISGLTGAAFAVALALAAPVLGTGVLAVPSHLRHETTLILRLSAFALFSRCLVTVLNTPQLVRMRTDLYVGITTIGSLLQIVLVAAAVFLGYGLIGAVTCIVAATIFLTFMHYAASSQLLPGMLAGRVSGALVGRLSLFGASVVVSSIAAVILTHGEKFLLTYYSSVRELAYYSVAVTCAGLLVMLPQAIGQLLLPAFAQLHAQNDAARTNMLFDRMLRAYVLYVAPAVAAIWLAGRTFLAVWAGPEFAEGGGTALTVLAFGYGTNVLAYAPYFLLMGSGRNQFVARLHVAELVPYVLIAVALIPRYGATGAALAWTLRALADATALFWLARRTLNVSMAGVAGRWPGIAAVCAAAGAPVVLSMMLGPVAALVTGLIAAPVYVVVAFAWLLDGHERQAVIVYGRRMRSWTEWASHG
jgi:O-antigen/teichoic acid export membrane protein